ncbi:hypothetical protein DXG03_006307 [Asterophora parasitica]|uniref:Uncharacterized protein n=1 Tax=Asterophora parasitica TaxID=117018 RepID=A0A9P7FYT4_9AGAR|nr:hypothetical protein DXG03_006307 [Asterophora parasitica]
MAAVAVENWRQPHHFAPMGSHFYPVHPQLTPDFNIPPHNEREMSRDFLITVLNFFASLLPLYFGNHQLRLVVHGGACMLLHPSLAQLANDQHYLAASSPANSPHNVLPRRTSTRDVDYIRRMFVADCKDMGINNVTERIKHCIWLTAQHFELGADWMNSDADVALPMSVGADGETCDPIYRAALDPNNIHRFTVFTSSNHKLTLVSVPPVWSVILKLVRYTKHDPGDICILLRQVVARSKA